MVLHSVVTARENRKLAGMVSAARKDHGEEYWENKGCLWQDVHIYIALQNARIHETVQKSGKQTITNRCNTIAKQEKIRCSK